MAATTKSNIKQQTAGQENGRSPDTSPLPETAMSTPLKQKPAHQPQKWALAIAVTLVVVFLLWQVREGVWDLISMVGDQEAVSEYLIGYGAWGPMALAVAQLLQVLVAVIPGHVFLIAAGYVYGFWPGLILNMICIVAASQLGFALARWTGRPVVDRLVDKNTLDKWYAIGEKQGFMFFTIAFVLPMFPTDMMNFVAGLTGIRGTQFLAANILGRLPGAIMLTMIGAYGIRFAAWHWVVIGVFAATVYITGRLVVHRIEKKHENGVGAEQDMG
ncbi:MAG: TVP38/TMEM64 family protein [Anaerolineae bacterium]|nr:TVP38/TMEM64 family protein [Anaerolineae bacterium]